MPATPPNSPSEQAAMSRRSFLRTSAVLTSGLAALAASLSPLLEMEDIPSAEKFSDQHSAISTRLRQRRNSQGIQILRLGQSQGPSADGAPKDDNWLGDIQPPIWRGMTPA